MVFDNVQLTARPFICSDHACVQQQDMCSRAVHTDPSIIAKIDIIDREAHRSVNSSTIEYC